MTGWARERGSAWGQALWAPARHRLQQELRAPSLMGRTAGALLTGNQEPQGLGQPRWPHGHRQSGPQEPGWPLEEYALHLHPACCPLSLARFLG